MISLPLERLETNIRSHVPMLIDNIESMNIMASRKIRRSKMTDAELEEYKVKREEHMRINIQKGIDDMVK